MLNRLITITLLQIATLPYKFIDFLLPDITIVTPIRAYFASLFWSISLDTRIRKGFCAGRVGNIRIGNNCYLNKDNFFDNEAHVSIGDNCSIGFSNKFLTVNHIEKNKLRAENKFSFYSREIIVGNNVWITTNCVILPGSTIKDHVIITPNTVVKGTLESHWVYGGNPIKKIRKTEGIIEKNI